MRGRQHERVIEIEDHWMSVADLMAALMFIFVLIATSFMLAVQERQKTYVNLKEELYRDLHREFRADFQRWNAELDPKTRSIRFTDEDVLFPVGRANLRPAFQEILKDFIPRYIHELLWSSDYRQDIVEIRIEGHTSTEWNDDISLDAAYVRNMELSQSRTRAVLAYILDMPEVQSDAEFKGWLKDRLTANGLSSSSPIQVEGREDPVASRRVEFRAVVDAAKYMEFATSNGSDP